MDEQQEPAVGSADLAARTSKTYRIGDSIYRMEPGCFVQHQWLAEGPLHGMDFGDQLTEQQLEPMIRAQGAALLGIVLIPDGMTRAQKAAAGQEAAQQLGAQIAGELDYAEVRAMVHDFFLIDGFRNLYFFVDLRALAARIDPETIATGSMPVSVSSAGETSQNETGSEARPDRSTANTICAGSLNGS
jgi:hypothetical protein